MFANGLNLYIKKQKGAFMDNAVNQNVNTFTKENIEIAINEVDKATMIAIDIITNLARNQKILLHRIATTTQN